MKKILAWALLATMVGYACDDAEKEKNQWAISSPQKNLEVTVLLDDSSRLFYTVKEIKNEVERTIIEASPLGLVRNDGTFADELSFVEMTAAEKISDDFETLSGKQSHITSEANQFVLTFTNKNQRLFQVIFRAYDKGVAFKYHFPEDSEKVYTIVDETTGFHIPSGKAWIQPYDSVTKYTPAYEKFYMNGIATGTTSPSGNGWCFPALFKSSTHWILLTEAGLADSFYGAHLNPDAPDGMYSIRLPEPEEAMQKGEVSAASPLPLSTLWRVIMISEDLGDIVESDLVKTLSPPVKINDVNWIKPGAASWSWLSDHDSPQHYDKMLPFIDLAADMGWKYFLVDANWNMMQGGNIEELISYAGNKEVDILMWYNSGGPHNVVTEQPRDVMFNPETRKEEMQKLQDWGVKGIKVDFFQSDKPWIMQLYLDILKDAAEHEIMVNFHGCTIPRGWSRTYPNLLTSESVKGAEVYTFGADYPENAPWHNTILPATRNVVGSMDYTPVIFTDQQYPHITTYAHELALAVLFESGIQHFSDAVAGYQNLPPEPKEFLKAVPAAWDETHYVAGMPGKDMIIARRKGDEWFVGGINGESVSKKMTVILDFLGKGKYQMTVISDGEHDQSFRSETRQVNQQHKEEVSMLGHGGFSMHLRKI